MIAASQKLGWGVSYLADWQAGLVPTMACNVSVHVFNALMIQGGLQSKSFCNMHVDCSMVIVAPLSNIPLNMRPGRELLQERVLGRCLDHLAWSTQPRMTPALLLPADVHRCAYFLGGYCKLDVASRYSLPAVNDHLPHCSL